MTELLSRGDQIRTGKYTLHSKFKSAANFSLGGSFLFVVDSSIGPGPLNIVLKGAAIESIDSIEVMKNRFRLNGQILLSYRSKTYNSRGQIFKVHPGKLIYNLGLFSDALLEYSHPKSLAFLLDPSREIEFKTPFEREYVRRFEAGYREITSGELLRGIRMIRGLGPGLTPSGDDFISGFIISLKIAQIITETDFSHTINSVYRISLGKNPFTNAFLKCAANFRLSGKLKSLIYSLVSSGRDIPENTRQLLTAGETSGADQGIGLLTGLKRFIE